uniref:Uncharacterized protein n=1 Tax=Panagrolaimus sp. ES5 TaxID=591445 RepID=A0AC34GN78_9BILA
MSSQHSDFQASESSFHQQQSSDGDQSINVKNLAKKFDNTNLQGENQLQSFQTSSNSTLSTTSNSTATPIGVSQSARLIEAGAKLQQEAAAIKREVPFNVHQQGEVRQTTCVSAAGIEAVAHAREVSTFREIQPPQTTTSGIVGGTTSNQFQGQIL